MMYHEGIKSDKGGPSLRVRMGERARLVAFQTKADPSCLGNQGSSGNCL